MKTCNKCKKEKPFSEFYDISSNVRSNTAKINTYRSGCKLCHTTEVKEYYLNNKEKRLQYHKKYNKENREKIQATKRVYRASPRGKQTHEANRKNSNEKRRKWQNEKRKTDPLWRLQLIIRCSIRRSFCRSSKEFKKTSRTHEILGCSFEEFKTYIKNQFKEGMTFDNIHLDHIVPVSLGETEEEIIALNHYSNFQPLPAKDNIKKGNKLILDIISPENKIRYKDIISRNM
jgi:hypothetical protein